jgi:hypothetical protein
MVNLRRRDFVAYAAAAAANIGAFSTLGYATSRFISRSNTTVGIPAGGRDAHAAGQYGDVIDWPIIAIHAVLLPSGAVMSFGTDQSGNQGGFIHDVWDPTQGTGAESHYTLPNGVTADFFCSAASVMTNGQVLIADGDLTIKGQRNYSNDASSVFDPRTNTIVAGPATGIYRWYPSFVSLPNGEKAIFGGLYSNRATGIAPSGGTPSITPQITNSDKSWKPLTGATSATAFGNVYESYNWYYPRANVIPGGNVGVLTSTGLIFVVDTSGPGSITRVGETKFSGNPWYPTIAFAPGKWLSIRDDQVVIKLQFASGGSPTVTQVASLDQDRIWGNATVLADGRVLVNGGSTVFNELIGVSYQDIIWDPATEQWTPGAKAAIPRLYHNTSLLLSDATVLTAGGGAPGPLINLNAQIYYPSYLYAPDGSPAVRPTLDVQPKLTSPGTLINGTVGQDDQIARVTALRTGATTHDYNSDAVFLTPTFTQTRQQLSIQLPDDTSQLIPGFWMIFAWNDKGVPSQASVIRVAVR